MNFIPQSHPLWIQELKITDVPDDRDLVRWLVWLPPEPVIGWRTNVAGSLVAVTPYKQFGPGQLYRFGSTADEARHEAKLYCEVENSPERSFGANWPWARS